MIKLYLGDNTKHLSTTRNNESVYSNKASITEEWVRSIQPVRNDKEKYCAEVINYILKNYKDAFVPGLPSIRSLPAYKGNYNIRVYNIQDKSVAVQMEQDILTHFKVADDEIEIIDASWIAKELQRDGTWKNGFPTWKIELFVNPYEVIDESNFAEADEIKLYTGFDQWQEYIQAYKYNGATVFYNITPTGYRRHQVYAIVQDGNIIHIDSFNHMYDSDVKDLIDNYNATGEYGIKCFYKTKKKPAFYELHPNGNTSI